MSSGLFGLLAELADLVGKTRDLAARRPLVDDAALGGAHQLRLGRLEGAQRLLLVAARNRLFDRPEVGTHARTPRLVDLGAARDLAARLLGGFGIGHKGSVVCGARGPRRAVASARKSNGGEPAPAA